MIDLYQQSIINDTNSRYYGFNSDKLVEQVGSSAAKLLVSKYGLKHSFAFVCGLGNTGAIGITAARHLAKLGAASVRVYLAGRSNDLKTSAGSKAWQKLLHDKIEYSQDIFGKDIEKHEIFIECLLGTGFNGKLYKRFHDIVFRLTRLKSKIVAIDNPLPGYKWDYAISTGYPKTEDSVVIDIEIPEKVLRYTGPGEMKIIKVPRKHSYKTQNGQVLIIGGSEKYIGAPQLAAKAAANYAGLTYLYSPTELDLSMAEPAEFILVSDSDLHQTIEQVDTILIGPGLAENYVNETLINSILRDFPTKTFVLDSKAIVMADKNLVSICGKVIMTPHRGELSYIFAKSDQANLSKHKSLEGQLRRYAIKHHCYINLKSSVSLLFGADAEFKFNTSGNAGMAKGGTGDAMAGLTAAFATRNDPWIAMSAAAFINGLAGDLAAQELGFNYSVNETISFQQKAMQLCYEF